MTEPVYLEIVPGPPGWRIDWQIVEQAFDWFRALDGCPQDPVSHAEGDVLVHTRMVCEALVADPAWRQLAENDRALLFWSALLHDVAKPDCTKNEPDGRISSRGHPKRGQIMARRILWQVGLGFEARETLCHLVIHHQLPLYLVENQNPERRAHLISLQTRCDWLAMLSEADARGRICPDLQRLLENIELFRELCREQACYDAPRAFASGHSRFVYFRRVDRSADYHAYDDTRSNVTLLSGLPASGKNFWISKQSGEASIVSLDDLRKKMNVSPGGNQGPVIAAAKEQARIALRAGKPLIWNATNLSREMRLPLLNLFADYNAQVSIVYLETGPGEQARRNNERADPVPAQAMARMFARWEVPDRTECHRLDVVIN